ncbi:hypothetical protein [Trichocoleus sp. ST-U2]|uniref:hypothetical protein n=1 Tax=Trichocoleus sp. ST-U2 TaxID=2933929 RepID=UPI0019B1031D|nr:hypothetical protein [Coleofasciculus sp. FACHB-SPT9]
MEKRCDRLASSHKRDRLGVGRSIRGINLHFSHKLTRPNASPLHRECDRPLFPSSFAFFASWRFVKNAIAS